MTLPLPAEVRRTLTDDETGDAYAVIGGHKAKERVLTSDITRQTKRISSLESDITRRRDTLSPAQK